MLSSQEKSAWTTSNAGVCYGQLFNGVTFHRLASTDPQKSTMHSVIFLSAEKLISASFYDVDLHESCQTVSFSHVKTSFSSSHSSQESKENQQQTATFLQRLTAQCQILPFLKSLLVCFPLKIDVPQWLRNHHQNKYRLAHTSNVSKE